MTIMVGIECNGTASSESLEGDCGRDRVATIQPCNVISRRPGR